MKNILVLTKVRLGGEEEDIYYNDKPCFEPSLIHFS